MRFFAFLFFLTACVLAPVAAEADYVDDFEAPARVLGDIHNQGPWVDFGGTLTTDVVNNVAYSGEQCMAQTINGAEANGYGSDVYIIDLDGAPVTSGTATVSYQLLIPQNFNGREFMWLSQGSMPGAFIKGAAFIADNRAGQPAVLYDEDSGDSAPLVFDRWAEVVADIDLDNDTVSVSYDGTVFHTGAWDDANTGTPSIGGMNAWVQDGNSGTAYVDDFSIVVPEPGTVTLLLMGLAAIAVTWRRRK